MLLPSPMFASSRRAPILIAALALFAGGCASSLRVWEGDDCYGRPPDLGPKCQRLAGIPVQLGEVFVKQGELTKLAADVETKCDPTAFLEIAVLPGRTIYVDAKAARLGKTQFSVNNHPNGILAGLAMNSDISEGVTAGTEALTELLPFFGLIPAPTAERAAGDFKSLDRPPADTGDDGPSVHPPRQEGYMRRGTR